MEWTRVAPVYPVADISKAIEWYSQVFGFEARIVNPPGESVPSYAVLYRDEVRLHLLRRDEAPHGLSAPVQRSSGSTRGWTTFSRVLNHSEPTCCNARTLGRGDTAISWSQIPTATSCG